MPPTPTPVNGNFVTEGTFLAMATGFPGVSAPIDPANSRLHKLALSSDGQTVYALSRGPEPRILQFAPKGTYGFAVDHGTEPACIEHVALGMRLGKWGDGLLLASHTESGTRLTALPTARLGHGIQEWHAYKSSIRVHLDLPEMKGVDLIVADEGTSAWLLTETSCVCLEWDKKEILLRGEIPVPGGARCGFLSPSSGLLVVSRDGGIYSIGDNAMHLEASLPDLSEATCLTTTSDGLLWADPSGSVSEWSVADGKAVALGRVPLLPVSGLAKVPDGRVFASAGEDIAHWYVLEADDAQARDLGVPVSTLTARRYGFHFAHLLVGRDGEVYAAEDDMGGHLWLYFPAAPGRRSSAPSVH